jgi:threonine/homoserine/homoserine lactone efflux protein
MPLHTWWLFVGVTFLVSATPGPNMMLVMSTSARHGLRGAVATMSGCLLTLAAMNAVSAAGLGAMLQAFPAVFDALRWAGAAYLAYLGLRSWRAAPGAPAPGSDAAPLIAPLIAPTLAPPAVPRGRGALFRQGVLVAASNPKAILFAAAFLPQFIHPELPRLPQFAILLVTFAVIEIAWYLVYAGSGRQLAAFLCRPEVLRAFNRITGGVFIGFAALIAADRS